MLSLVMYSGNQANPAQPPSSAQLHFYRKGQQGAVSFVYNLKNHIEIHSYDKRQLLLAVPFCRNGIERDHGDVSGFP